MIAFTGQCLLLLLTGCFTAITAHVTAGTCGQPGSISEVTIPQGMLLTDFDQHVLNKKLPRLYYTLPKPPKYKQPYFVYTIQLEKLKDHEYNIDYWVEKEKRSDGTRDCISLPEKHLSTHTQYAMFRNEGEEGTLTVYWSSCPQNYIWVMRCFSWIHPILKCPRNNTEFLLFIEDDPHNLAFYDVVQDLLVTGVQFGDQDYYWHFNYDGNLCIKSNAGKLAFNQIGMLLMFAVKLLVLE